MSVVVVGGGVAGLLTAAAMAAGGADVSVLESGPIGGTQTLSCHGYLHLGYAYAEAERALCRSFADAVRQWSVVLDGVAPVVATSSVLFTDDEAARAATVRWSRRGLPVQRAAAPEWARSQAPYGFVSAEPTYDMSDVVARAAAICRSLGVRLIPGVSVTSVRETGNVVEFDVERSDGVSDADSPRVADALVIAAGAATRGLVPEMWRKAIANRLSYMLVLAGDLPLGSAIFPESNRHGLFIACRRGPTADERVWLLSTFHSFDERGAECDILLPWWAQHVLNSVQSLAGRQFFDAVSHVGAYSTIKSGLVPTAGTVAAAGVYQSAHSRIVAAVPSKFTLAPVVADAAAVAALRIVGRPASADESLVLSAARAARVEQPPLRTSEMWRERLLVPFDASLLPRTDGRFHDVLSVLTDGTKS